MSLLQCSQCGKDISATHKMCPHCGVKISFWREVKNAVEKNRMRQVFLAIFMVFLLATTWYIRMNTGLRWPMYTVVILCMPIVPWLLQLAYKSAAPVEEDAEERASTRVTKARGGKARAEQELDEQKIWRG